MGNIGSFLSYALPTLVLLSCSSHSDPSEAPDAGSSAQSETSEAGSTSGNDASVCTIPSNATTIDGGWGCQPDPTLRDCTLPADTCVLPCAAGEFTLQCLTPQSAPAGQPPPPDPSLGCKLGPTSEPSYELIWCCPCGQ
jgi:hypothetical protein